MNNEISLICQELKSKSSADKLAGFMSSNNLKGNLIELFKDFDYRLLSLFHPLYFKFLSLDKDRVLTKETYQSWYHLAYFAARSILVVDNSLRSEILQTLTLIYSAKNNSILNSDFVSEYYSIHQISSKQFAHRFVNAFIYGISKDLRQLFEKEIDADSQEKYTLLQTYEQTYTESLSPDHIKKIPPIENDKLSLSAARGDFYLVKMLCESIAGRDLFLMSLSALPENKKNCYILENSAQILSGLDVNPLLYYINDAFIIEEVIISDAKKFKEKFTEISQDKKESKIVLSSDDIKNLITSNGGHITRDLSSQEFFNAFFHAAINGHNSILCYLMQRQESIKPQLLSFALKLAIFRGFDEVVASLIHYGAALEADDSWPEHALGIAIQTGRVDLVAFLMEFSYRAPQTEKDFALLKQDPFNQSSINLQAFLPVPVLIMAVESGQMHVVDFLLNYKSRQGENCYELSLKVRDEAGLTPMMIAAEGNLPMLAYLYQQGCSLLEKDSQGNTLAHIAARYNQEKILHWLAEKKLDLTAENNEGQTPLMLAASHNCFLSADALIKLLGLGLSDLEGIFHLIIEHDSFQVMEGFLSLIRPNLELLLALVDNAFVKKRDKTLKLLLPIVPNENLPKFLNAAIQDRYIFCIKVILKLAITHGIDLKQIKYYTSYRNDLTLNLLDYLVLSRHGDLIAHFYGLGWSDSAFAKAIHRAILTEQYFLIPPLLRNQSKLLAKKIKLENKIYTKSQNALECALELKSKEAVKIILEQERLSINDYNLSENKIKKTLIPLLFSADLPEISVLNFSNSIWFHKDNVFEHFLVYLTKLISLVKEGTAIGLNYLNLENCKLSSEDLRILLSCLENFPDLYYLNIDNNNGSKEQLAHAAKIVNKAANRQNELFLQAHNERNATAIPPIEPLAYPLMPSQSPKKDLSSLMEFPSLKDDYKTVFKYLTFADLAKEKLEAVALATGDATLSRIFDRLGFTGFGLMKLSQAPQTLSISELRALLREKPYYALVEKTSTLFYIDSNYASMKLGVKPQDLERLKAIFSFAENQHQEASPQDLETIISLTGHSRHDNYELAGEKLLPPSNSFLVDLKLARMLADRLFNYNSDTELPFSVALASLYSVYLLKKGLVCLDELEAGDEDGSNLNHVFLQNFLSSWLVYGNRGHGVLPYYLATALASKLEQTAYIKYGDQLSSQNAAFEWNMDFHQTFLYIKRLSFSTLSARTHGIDNFPSALLIKKLKQRLIMGELKLKEFKAKDLIPAKYLNSLFLEVAKTLLNKTWLDFYSLKSQWIDEQKIEQLPANIVMKIYEYPSILQQDKAFDWLCNLADKLRNYPFFSQKLSPKQEKFCHLMQWNEEDFKQVFFNSSLKLVLSIAYYYWQDKTIRKEKEFQNYEFIYTALNKMADNCQFRQPSPAIIRASQSGNLTTVQAYLDRKINRESLEFEPLIDLNEIIKQAIINDQLELLTWFIQEPSFATELNYFLMIKVAAEYGKVNALDRLYSQLKNNFADPSQALKTLFEIFNAKDEEGKTLAHDCCFKGQGLVINWLLTQGVFKLNAPCQGGKTGLMYAASAGHLQVVKQLLFFGANLYARDLQSKTILHHALASHNTLLVSFLHGILYYPYFSEDDYLSLLRQAMDVDYKIDSSLIELYDYARLEPKIREELVFKAMEHYQTQLLNTLFIPRLHNTALQQALKLSSKQAKYAVIQVLLNKEARLKEHGISLDLLPYVLQPLVHIDLFKLDLSGFGQASLSANYELLLKILNANKNLKLILDPEQISLSQRQELESGFNLTFTQPALLNPAPLLTARLSIFSQSATSLGSERSSLDPIPPPLSSLIGRRESQVVHRSLLARSRESYEQDSSSMSDPACNS